MNKNGYNLSLIGATTYLLFALSWFVANITLDEIGFWWIAFSIALTISAISMVVKIESANKENTNITRKIGDSGLFILLTVLFMIIIIGENDDIYSIYPVVWAVSAVLGLIGLLNLRKSTSESIQQNNNNIQQKTNTEKLLRIVILILTLVNTIVGAVVFYFEVIESRYFYTDYEAISSYFACFTLIASGIYGIILMKAKSIGAYLAMASSVMVLIFGFSAQVGEVIFYNFADPSIRIFQIFVLIVVAVYLITQQKKNINQANSQSNRNSN